MSHANNPTTASGPAVETPEARTRRLVNILRAWLDIPSISLSPGTAIPQIEPPGHEWGTVVSKPDGPVDFTVPDLPHFDEDWNAILGQEVDSPSGIGVDASEPAPPHHGLKTKTRQRGA
jgi:hypothetical protein